MHSLKESLAEQVHGRLRRSKAMSACAGGLTPRQREVLDLVGQGLTSKQIAERLGLSVETVANHRKQLCRKLGVHSTAALVAYGAKKPCRPE